MSERARWPDAPRGAVAVVALLYVLHAALYPFATLVIDSGRDLANGLAIASGAGLPDYGPALFGVWHLGPAWYALLALPLWLFGSVGATALFVGCLAALKIPLAFALGRRLGDGTLGLLCALFAAVPGWQILGALVLSHTALVEALLYATLLCCVCAVQRREPAYATLAALMLALALHAHPTALLGAPAVAWALWCSTSRRRVAWFGLAALAFALPFAPMLLAEARSGWPQFAGTGRYLGDSAFATRALRLPQVVWGAGWNASVFVREFLLQRVPGTGWLWQIGVAVAWLGAFAGALLALHRRGVRTGAELFVASTRDVRPLVALCAWLGGVLFVCLLRDTTPAWMTYALAPLQAVFWALGWHALLRSPAPRAIVALLIAVPVCAVACLLVVDRLAVQRAGLQAIPGAAVSDVAVPVQREPASRMWLTAMGHDAIAQRICSEPGVVALHGDLAAAFDFGQGVAAQLHCDATQLPQLGGAIAVRHLAGVPQALAATLGLDATQQSHGFVLVAPARGIFPPRGRPARAETTYRADDIASLQARGGARISVDVECAADQWLVVTNLWPGLNPLQLDVRSDGAPLRPTTTTLASHVYRCHAGDERVEARTTLSDAIDMFVLESSATP